MTDKMKPRLVANEAPFMIAFREGNNDVFKEIYERLSLPLTNYVAKIIRCPMDVEDVVAHAFYKLFLCRAGMESYNHIRRWMYVVAYNKAIDCIRKDQRRREGRDELSYLSGDWEDDTDSEHQRDCELANAICQLPRQRKKILGLYFFEEKTTGEIAELMGLRPQTVLNHKTKGIDSLRKTLAFLWE